MAFRILADSRLGNESTAAQSSMDRKSADATARMAFAFVALVALNAAVAASVDPQNQVFRAAFAVALATFLYGGTIYFLGQRGITGNWVPFTNLIVYLTTLSLLTARFVVILPIEHMGWLSILFMLYIMIVGITSLRSDFRVPIFAGLLAATQLTAVTLFALWYAGRCNATRAEALLREFDGVRLVALTSLIAGATLLAASLARRGQMLEINSVRDALTGLLNRRVFEELLGAQHRQAARRRHPVTIAVIDLDHFKQVNDRFGHAAGDAVLQNVGQILQRAFRNDDFIARYGGEEFVAVVPNTSEDVVLARAESLRREVENSSVTDPATGVDLRVTISVGVASWPDDGDDLNDVLQAADRRLYAAKDGGRNRVESRSRDEWQAAGRG